MNIRLMTALASTVVSFEIAAQGTFGNLNFELANPGPLYQGPTGPPYADNVSVADALPYWSVYFGSLQQTQINVNDPSLGATAVTLIATGDNPIDGSYSVLLQGSTSTASISQAGMIPAGTETLLFKAQSSAPLEVFVGGQEVPFSAVGAGPNYTLYGANISAWGGETEQVTFSALNGGFPGSVLLDDISFSPQSVPEPSPLILTGAGAIVIALYRRFAPKR